jgi:hypothetical protein
LDKHGIPCPQPRTRDTLTAKARENYENIRKTIGDTATIPGNWLFEVWSDSDLKSWCDYRGIPVPQGSKRNELIALVRRNMRKVKFQGQSAYLSAAATLSSIGHVAYDEASKLYDEAAAGAAKATDQVWRINDEAFEAAVASWSESRLKAYLDERGVPVPQGSKLDELRALMRHNAHRAKVRAGFYDDAFDTWSTEQLQAFLGKKVKGTRDELISLAHKQYSSASAKGGDVWKTMTAEGAKVTGHVFEHWSESDLRHFLDSYGIGVDQGSKRSELIDAARKHSRYFTQGPNWYTHTWARQVMTYVNECLEYFKEFIAGVSGGAYNVGEKIGDEAKEYATMVKHRAEEAAEKVGHRGYEKGQQAYDKVKEDL